METSYIDLISRVALVILSIISAYIIIITIRLEVKNFLSNYKESKQTNKQIVNIKEEVVSAKSAFEKVLDIMESKIDWNIHEEEYKVGIDCIIIEMYLNFIDTRGRDDAEVIIERLKTRYIANGWGDMKVIRIYKKRDDEGYKDDNYTIEIGLYDSLTQENI